MKRTIYWNICLMALISLVLGTVTTVLFMEQDLQRHMRQEVRVETEYLRAAVETTGQHVLTRLQENADSEEANRITWIGSDGEVYFDSVRSSEELQNHLERPEVQQALNSGKGEAVRLSKTLDENTYYYALRLEDGSVIRVANTTRSSLASVLHTIPLLLMGCMLILAITMVLARIQTAKIVRPVNELDLDDPETGAVYDELSPLIERIKKQNATIRQQILMLSERQDLRREFSANVSHELKTPLTSISGYAEIMKNGLVKPEDMSRFAGKIYQEAQRMITLIGDIIRLSRLDEGLPGGEHTDVNLYEVAEEALETLRDAAKGKQITMKLEGSAAVIQGDPRLLREMIYNLCDNAIKYNRPEGSVCIRVGSVKGKVQVEVTDTGIGIPKEDQQRIFERFYRVDKSHSRQIGGTGLGLSIVKHGAIYHGAEILLDSELGKGTRITLRFA